MKKPKFKLLKEFKEFINKGSVLDLAVGMIIGGAFTAIVAALVGGILTPLINMIPIGDEGNLQVVLREAVTKVVDGEVVVVKDAVIMDFGQIISAIITFLCTALVLFLIIKAINTAKKAGEKAKQDAEALAKKALGEEEKVEEAAAEEAPAEPAAPAEPVETTDDVLKEIRDLLKAQAGKED